MVESHAQWRARVVYGDTDSLFVLLPGRSRADAFRIGAEIAAQATATNPPPVTLKMEKARHLQPVFLQRFILFSEASLVSQPAPIKGHISAWVADRVMDILPQQIVLRTRDLL